MISAPEVGEVPHVDLPEPDVVVVDEQTFDDPGPRDPGGFALDTPEGEG
jgi:hypothetical protein